MVKKSNGQEALDGDLPTARSRQEIADPTSTGPFLTSPPSIPITQRVISLGFTSGIAALAVFARETVVVRHFGATPVTDAFYLTLAPTALFLAMLVAVAEIRFVPLIAQDAFARRRELERLAIRAGAAIALVWLVLSGATLVVRTNPRFSTLPSLLAVEGIAMVPFALYATHRSILLARDQLGIANLAAALGTAAGVVLIFSWGQPFALPLSVLLMAIVQWVIVATAVNARSHSEHVIPVVVGGGLKKLAISMLLTGSLTSIQRLIATALGIGAVTGLAIAERIYQVPATLVPASIAGAAFPRLAKARTDNELRQVSAQSMSIVVALTAPVLVGGLLFAPDVVAAVSGSGLQRPNQFASVVAALSVFCLCVPLYASTVVQARMLVVSGREDIVARVGILAAAINLPIAICGALVWGIPGIAAANLAAFASVSIYTLAHIWRLPWVARDRVGMLIGRNAMPQLVLGGPGVAGLVVIHQALPAGGLRLALAVVAGAAATIGMLLPTAENRVLDSLAARLTFVKHEGARPPKGRVP